MMMMGTWMMGDTRMEGDTGDNGDTQGRVPAPELSPGSLGAPFNTTPRARPALTPRSPRTDLDEGAVPDAGAEAEAGGELRVQQGTLEPHTARGARRAALGDTAGQGGPKAPPWCQETAGTVIPGGGDALLDPPDPLQPPLTSTASDLGRRPVAKVTGGSPGSGGSSSRLRRDGAWSCRS